MVKLLLIKERMVELYNKNEVYITPAIKLMLALITLGMINTGLGYFALFNNILIVLAAALMCSFLPYSGILYVGMLFCMGHFYAIGVEALLVGAVAFFLIYILFIKFIAKEALVLAVLPLLFALKIPYVIPVLMGLIATPVSVVSLSCGVVAYYVIYHIDQNAATLSTMSADSAIQKLRIIIDAILNDKSLILTIIAFGLTMLVVYMVRRMQIEHAWTVGMISGYITSLIILLIGDLLFDLEQSILGMFVGIIVSFGITKVLEFFLFNVDYSRVESVQFEDDEYYYYVKAVPKISLSTPQKKVKKINAQDKKTYPY